MHAGQLTAVHADQLTAVHAGKLPAVHAGQLTAVHAGPLAAVHAGQLTAKLPLQGKNGCLNFINLILLCSATKFFTFYGNHGKNVKCVFLSMRVKRKFECIYFKLLFCFKTLKH